MGGHALACVTDPDLRMQLSDAASVIQPPSVIGELGL